MTLNSFFEESGKLHPLEVEVELWPGLPEIHFLGGADQHLKESAKRIKSAIKSQGFEFRPNLQVLVNLRPSYLKKSSRGLELAIAIGYLVESGQIQPDPSLLKETFYGELSLKGDVSAPENLGAQYLGLGKKIVTGNTSFLTTFSHYPIRQLQDIMTTLNLVPPSHPGFKWEPPLEILDLKISAKLARLLGIFALGNHSILFAGTSGSGKTTAARILHALMPPPNPLTQELLLKAHSELPIDHKVWRPFVNPHHTIPLNSLIGGGNDAYGGELARSHQGLLLLDEFFEFSAHVLESLREPLESRSLRVTRGKIVRTFPLQNQVVATTNLCPCGEWIPGEGAKPGCRFSLQKCRSYSSRVTGPLLDRFEALVFTSNKQADLKEISVRELRLQVENKREPFSEALLFCSDWAQTSKDFKWLLQDARFTQVSERRKAATIKLAQSIALWETGALKVSGQQLEEASHFTVLNFHKVKHWDLG